MTRRLKQEKTIFFISHLKVNIENIVETIHTRKLFRMKQDAGKKYMPYIRV